MYYKKRTFLLFVCCCVSVAFLFAHSESNNEINRQMVKIGFLGSSNYFSADEKDEIDSYGRKYFDLISNYTNYDFEFVSIKTIDEMYEALDTGLVDIFFGGIKDSVHKNNYLYSNKPIDSLLEILITSVYTKHINYEDYTAINNSKIGYINNQICLDLLNSYIKEHNLNVDLVGYDSALDLKNALHKDEISIAYGNNLSFANEGKIIDVLGYLSTFQIYNKNNIELKSEMDKASSLFTLYYNDKLSLIDTNDEDIYFIPAFSNEEQAYLFSHPEINVLIENDNYPFEYLTNGHINGVTQDILNLISSKTSLYFNYITQEQFDTGDYKNVIKINYTDYGIDRENFDVLPLYLNLLYSQINLIDQEKFEKVGLKNTPEMREFAKYLKIDEDNIIYYDNYVDCYDAVKNKKVDYSIVPREIGRIFLNYPRYYMIEKNSPYSWVRNINFGYSKDIDPALKRIVYKSLSIINSENIEHYINQEIKEHKLKFTLVDFIHEHIAFSLSVLFIFLIMISGLIILFFIRYNSKKQISYVKECSIAKTNFLSKVSHDIRTPLNGIIGLINLSLEENDCETIKDNLNKIKISGDFILDLINQTLDLNKIENNKLELEETSHDLNQFYNELNEVFEYFISSKKINFIFEKHFDDKLHCASFDKLRLNQIYMNLLSNSIKFTNENGYITVYVKIDEVDDEYVISSYVKDTGSGMSQTFQQKMYNEYEQEKGSSKYKGTGLGLAITKNLVDLMNGAIICESEIGKGTTFHLNFKFKKCKNQNTKEINNIIVKKNDTKKNALIVDDNAINLKILKAYLEKLGLSVTSAKNGAEAVNIYEKSEEYYFDIIFMDIYMPVMDGLSASKAIRALSRLDSKKIHIVALTGSVFDKKLEELEASTINDIALKPLNPSKLKEIIESI